MSWLTRSYVHQHLPRPAVVDLAELDRQPVRRVDARALFEALAELLVVHW